MHVLLILKKHMLAFLETSFGRCCCSVALDGQLLNAIKSLYMHSEVCVRVNSATTKPFRVSVGLLQGCSLSPILFLTYMDRIVKKSESCGGVKIGECTVQRLLFADDLVLLDSTQNGLQQALDRFSDACSVAGMKISTRKTETMCLSRLPKQCSLHIDGVSLKQSEKFKYIGLSFTSDGRQNSELEIRIGKSKCSNAPAPPICGTETVASHQGKVIHFQIGLCSYSDLWP